MICAAYLHDVVEDTPVSLEEIKNKFGGAVARLVEELTDEYVKEKYQHLNRRRRKDKEVERQAKMILEDKSNKLTRVLNNTIEILLKNRGISRNYSLAMGAGTEVLQSKKKNRRVRRKVVVRMIK